MDLSTNQTRIEFKSETNMTIVNDTHYYSVGFHVGALFIILVVSLLGASVAVVSSRVKKLHINPIIIDCGKFFGSGVVLATGFIHMLPGAVQALTDPSLPQFWQDYQASAGLFAMLAALGMQFIEYVANEHYRKIFQRNKSVQTNSDPPAVAHSSEGRVEIVLPAKETHQHSGHQHGFIGQDAINQRRIRTYLLEMGIAFHSILIGVALGTEIDQFVPLLIALCFHQFFEGMALGAQIAGVKDMSTISAVLMVLVFALTTPIGVAIGIGVQAKAYDPNSVTALLVNGIFDSVSGGILIYVALVNLIGAEMGPHANSFHELKIALKILYFVAMYLGVAVMAIIGRWA